MLNFINTNFKGKIKNNICIDIILINVIICFILISLLLNLQRDEYINSY